MISSYALPLQVLRSYYPVVTTLGKYLQDVVVFEASHLGVFHETDSLAYRKLLQLCVVTRRGDDDRKLLKVTPVMGHLREVQASVSPAAITK